jgi:hypothetical protein
MAYDHRFRRASPLHVGLEATGKPPQAISVLAAENAMATAVSMNGRCASSRAYRSSGRSCGARPDTCATFRRLGLVRVNE